MSKTIMLIHGAWLNAHGWEGFKARYKARGYTVIAPSWPLDDPSPAELRASPNPALAKIGINEIINHYDRLIRALPEPPILIGHSFGGTVTQRLPDRLGAAGVAIDPAPTSGVLVGWQTVKSTFPCFLSWGSWHRVMTMSRRFFWHALRTDRAAGAGRCHVRPLHRAHPGKIYADGLVASAGKIRWNNPDRAPLLLIGGGIDLIAEAKLTTALFKKHQRAPSGHPTFWVEGVHDVEAKSTLPT